MAAPSDTRPSAPERPVRGESRTSATAAPIRQIDGAVVARGDRSPAVTVRSPARPGGVPDRVDGLRSRPLAVDAGFRASASSRIARSSTTERAPDDAERIDAGPAR